MNAENAAALREKRCRKATSGNEPRSRAAAPEQLIEIEAGTGTFHIIEQRGAVVIDKGEFKGRSGNGQFLKRGECVNI